MSEEDKSCEYREICGIYAGEYNSSPIIKKDSRQFCDDLSQTTSKEIFCPMYDFFDSLLPLILSSQLNRLDKKLENTFQHIKDHFERMGKIKAGQIT